MRLPVAGSIRYSPNGPPNADGSATMSVPSALSGDADETGRRRTLPRTVEETSVLLPVTGSMRTTNGSAFVMRMLPSLSTTTAAGLSIGGPVPTVSS